MDTGTQMVLEVKKNKLNNSSKWFTFGQKLDRSLKLRSSFLSNMNISFKFYIFLITEILEFV